MAAEGSGAPSGSVAAKPAEEQAEEQVDEPEVPQVKEKRLRRFYTKVKAKVKAFNEATFNPPYSSMDDPTAPFGGMGYIG